MSRNLGLPKNAEGQGLKPLRVSQIGYGAWPLSYDERPPEEEAIAILHQALDLGVRLIDTSDAYCLNEGEKHHNEKLIRKALDSYPDQAVAKQVVVATKGICIRPEGRWERVATAAQVAKAIAGSVKALSGGLKPIDLWQVHWCQVQNGANADDKRVPMVTLLEPARQAIFDGQIKYVGLSNCTLEQVEAAMVALPPGRLVSVQNRYNMWDRTSERNGVLEFCQKEGLAFLPWSPLGGSTNSGDKGKLRDVDAFPQLNRIAAEKGCSPEALVLAYMQAKWPCVQHITSARRLAHLKDTLNSSSIAVSAEEIAAIDQDGDQGEGTPPWVVE